MKLWWDPCSCLKTWCRTRRGEGDKDVENQRAWCECVCVWMHMCNTSSLSSSPHFIQLCSGSNQTPPQRLEWRDWTGVLLAFLWSFTAPHNTKWLIGETWTKTHYSPVRDKDAPALQGCSQPMKSYLSNQYNHFFFPKTCSVFAKPYLHAFARAFDFSQNFVRFALGILLYLSHASSGWWIWHISNVLYWFEFCSDPGPCTFALTWLLLACWVNLMLV